MDEYEFKAVQQKLALFANFMKDLDVESFLEKIDHATAIGPLIDPTACGGDWMDNAHEWEKLGRAARDFKEAIIKIDFGGKQ